MKIGRLEVRWLKRPEAAGSKTTEDLSFVFTVPETHLWWQAIQQVIARVRESTIRAAQTCSANPNLVLHHVGASEGCDSVWQEFVSARDKAIAASTKLPKKAA